MPDMKASSVDYQALLTEQRLGSYFQAAQGDRMAAFALYEWNIEASAAAVSLSAMVEVVLRNALDRQLAALGEKKGWSDWLAEAPSTRGDVRTSARRECEPVAQVGRRRTVTSSLS